MNINEVLTAAKETAIANMRRTNMHEIHGVIDTPWEMADKLGTHVVDADGNKILVSVSEKNGRRNVTWMLNGHRNSAAKIAERLGNG